MEKEQRRSKRIQVSLQLEVSSLFKQDNIKVENLHAPIEIKNISKSGIGFETYSILPIGYYFNARLVFGNEDEVLNCVVRILRQEKREGGVYFYGCEFVGMTSVFDYIFDDLEKKEITLS